MSKIASNYICLAVILTDFVFQKYKNYYPQVLSKDVNILKTKEVIRYITDGLKVCLDDSHGE